MDRFCVVFCGLKLLLLFVIERTDSFNIEVRNPIVKRSFVNGSYFGFSVALHKNNSDNKWMLIGAPLAQNLQPLTKKSGALFKCSVDTRNQGDCTQVVTDGKRTAGGNYDLIDFDYEDDINLREPDGLKPPGNDEIKENQWLGVTVRSQKLGKNVVVCAHRYIQSPNLNLHHYGLGLCYLLDGALQVVEAFEPCKGKPMEGLHLQYAFCQAGTGLALLDDGFALIGAPGPLAWKGTIFARDVEGDYLSRDKTLYHSPLEETNVTEKYSYLGMSAAGGHFFRNESVTYVSGAPRSEHIGEVLLFQKQQNNDVLNLRLRLKGEQFGASFGYELLAVDVNNDGFDDLLVGAPFYYIENGGGGAVYIYYNLRDCTDSYCERTKLTGATESRFGFAMTSVGDINKDGYNDVAIGAPYEEDGAVYIYLGSSKGLQDTPSQVIKHKGIKALGYSLSGGIDMDNNLYPDLLVGAYESDTAIFYKTRPIIDIDIKIRGNFKNINASRKGCGKDPFNKNNTCFYFESCISIRGKLNNFENFTIEYRIEELLEKTKMSRVWFYNSKFPDKHANAKNVSGIVVKQQNQEICQNERVYIRESDRDILTPIEFSVRYLIEDDTPNSSILNKTSFQKFQATFLKDCGGDDECDSNLVLTAGCGGKREGNQYILHLRENDELRVDVNVSNFGDAAYEAKVFVLHPKTISYISISSSEKDKHDSVSCSLYNSTLVTCDLGNPLHSQKSVSVTLRFEILKNATSSMDFFIFVNSTSRELSNHTSQAFTAVLEKKVKFELVGKPLTTHVFFGGKIKGESEIKSLEDIGSKVKHRYQVLNNGDWSIQNMIIRIQWPHQVQSRRDEGKWLLYLEAKPTTDKGTCEVVPANYINTLNLFSTNLGQEEAENITTPITFTDTPENVRKRRRRKRRDLEDTPVPEKMIRTDGKPREIVTLDCISGTAKCIQIICMIKKLAKYEETTIDITSRIWNSTLTEDYSSVDWVSIRSTASIEISDSSVELDNDVIYVKSAETVAYPIIVPPEGVSLWIIIGSALVGLFLLFVLIFILYKLGFFKRNRVDPTLAGNLTKRDEIESLIMKQKS